MDSDFVRKRISQLRMQKGVSEYKMSLDLGHSKGYIQSISSGRALPSLGEFLYLCEYLEISPAEFFCVDQEAPILVNELQAKASALSPEDVRLLISLADRLNQKK